MCTADEKLTIASMAMALKPPSSFQAGIANYESFLLWPPDLFAFTSHMLSKTGTYTNVVAPPTHKEWPPISFSFEPGSVQRLSWGEEMRYDGEMWRNQLEKIVGSHASFKEYFNELNCQAALEEELARIKREKLVPAKLLSYWRTFTHIEEIEKEHNIEALYSLYNEDCKRKPADCKHGSNSCKFCRIWSSYEALMSMHAMADEACAGWGIRTPNTMSLRFFPESTIGKAQQHAEWMLAHRGTMATIHSSRGRVLPKRHTPEVGVTLRSLSANLAYHTSSVEVQWHSYKNKTNHLLEKFSSNQAKSKQLRDKPCNNRSLAILLFPWPFDIYSKDFKELDNGNVNVNMDKEGYFIYDPGENDTADFEKCLREVIRKGKKEVSKIDMVVLPECALGDAEFKILVAVLAEEKIPAYITGKRGKSNDNVFYENLVSINMANRNEAGEYIFDPSDEVLQHKHHPWKLDQLQVKKYNLGNELPMNRSLREGINIKRRVVNFMNIGEELTLCTLICEDLARQDPISDLIRTVAPSLMISILMDGPQLPGRWPAKYASVLAEDPGCTVITLTSLGMVKRCTQPMDKESRSIALISDSTGQPHQINMKHNSIGVLISLSLTPKHESLADGRVEYAFTNNLTLSSVYHILKEGC